jgi:hypothetical protein
MGMKTLEYFEKFCEEETSGKKFPVQGRTHLIVCANGKFGAGDRGRTGDVQLGNFL